MATKNNKIDLAPSLEVPCCLLDREYHILFLLFTYVKNHTLPIIPSLRNVSEYHSGMSTSIVPNGLEGMRSYLSCTVAELLNLAHRSEEWFIEQKFSEALVCQFLISELLLEADKDNNFIMLNFIPNNNVAHNDNVIKAQDQYANNPAGNRSEWMSLFTDSTFRTNKSIVLQLLSFAKLNENASLDARQTSILETRRILLELLSNRTVSKFCAAVAEQLKKYQINCIKKFQLERCKPTRKLEMKVYSLMNMTSLRESLNSQFKSTLNKCFGNVMFIENVIIESYVEPSTMNSTAFRICIMVSSNDFKKSQQQVDEDVNRFEALLKLKGKIKHGNFTFVHSSHLVTESMLKDTSKIYVAYSLRVVEEINGELTALKQKTCLTPYFMTNDSNKQIRESNESTDYKNLKNRLDLLTNEYLILDKSLQKPDMNLMDKEKTIMRLKEIESERKSLLSQINRSHDATTQNPYQIVLVPSLEQQMQKNMNNYETQTKESMVDMPGVYKHSQKIKLF
jgi:hypothetical protein